MIETKASRLQALSAIVTVPEFIVLKREDSCHLSLDSSCQYMVRSSSKLEDQDEFSQAGQFSTVGPIDKETVPATIQQLFQNDDVDEVIVQDYIEAKQWGVAFCFSEKSMLVEYTGEFEGVTSGTVNPFSAILPTTASRYKKLEKQLLKIVSRFGAADIEFVNPEDPRFVQVRPITRAIEFDENFVKLKMQLQELESPSWKENDVCRMLAERDNKSQAISELYLQALQDVYLIHLKRKINMPHQPFIKISQQYFMNQQLEEQIIPGFFELLRVGFRMSGILNDIKKQDFTRLSPVQLMQKSILLSLAYELFKKKEAMEMREEIRIELDQRIPQGRVTADFHYQKILASTIKFDKKRCIWINLSLRDEQGIVVVAGDLENGPYYLLKNRDQEIPPGVIVVTDYLYPEIGQYMTRIKGIICKYGALSAHVAILAREHHVPLRIQTSIEEYK
jgi:phosphoenolpyruvate synthase/pyruvate phosphate dikinase